MKLKFKRLNKNAILPFYATKNASGMDLSACIDETVCVQPGESAIISTGLAVELDEQYEAQIRGRSGLAFKHAVFAFPGTVDADYRGIINVLLTNNSRVNFFVEPGDRIAQMVISAAVVRCRPEYTDSLNETERGEGGFGSTGMSRLNHEDELVQCEGDLTGFEHIKLNDYPTDDPVYIPNQQTINILDAAVEENVAPHFRKGAPDQNEIMKNLLNVSKGQ